MCEVIGCGHGGSSSSPGVTAERVVGGLAAAAVLAVAWAVFQALWVPIGLAIVSGYALAYRTPRRALLALLRAMRWALRWAWAQATYRSFDRPWRIELYDPGTGRQLAAGVVRGPWAAPAAAEAEALTRAAAAGLPPLVCRASLAIEAGGHRG